MKYEFPIPNNKVTVESFEINIDNKDTKEISIEFNGLPVTGEVINLKAKEILSHLNSINKRYQELELDLAWKPVIDRNYRLLSKEELEKSLDNPRIKELLQTNMFKIEFPYDNSYNIEKTMTIDMSKEIGYIKSIDLEKRKVTVMIKNEMYSVISYFEPVVYFNYLGQSEYIQNEDVCYNRLYDMTIGKVGLMRRDLSSYHNK